MSSAINSAIAFYQEVNKEDQSRILLEASAG
jgi:hypothetical protein